MKKKKYEPIKQLSRDEAQQGLQSSDEIIKQGSLWSIALYDTDWKWAQDVCLAVIEDEETTQETRSVAIRCLGHIARLHRVLDVKRVYSILNKYNSNSYYAGAIEDATSDISIFVKTDES